MTKRLLRKEYLTKRVTLSEIERTHLTEKIAERFKQIHFPEIAFALSYMAMRSKAEIVATVIESKLVMQYPDCRFCYPKTDLGMNSMEAVTYDKGMMLKKNEWGIDEPENIDTTNPQQVDLILVPLLAFDKRGYRVGYGKGYYDRYTIRCRPDVITIGLSFFEPVENIEDVDGYDIPMKYCVTPEKLYCF